MRLKLEICVDSLESAMNAEKGGADRVELCSSLCLGGLTPTIGLLKTVKKHINIPVYCMIRCRHDHFTYTDQEMEVMREDLGSLKAAGADGFVFGALTENGTVDETNCSRIISEAAPLPVTFHRAFDCSSIHKWKENLRKTIDLGFARLLTSGLSSTAAEGRLMIRNIAQEASDNLIVMIGSGIDERNLADLMKAIGASCSASLEYHGSASSVRKATTAGKEGEEAAAHAAYRTPHPLKVTLTEKVRQMRIILDEYEGGEEEEVEDA